MSAMQLDTAELQRLFGLIWTPESTDNDKVRWLSTGFNWSEEVAWGLRQSHGGPCGVLAAVNAELVRIVLFARSEDLFTLQPGQRDMALADAMATILWRAASGGAGEDGGGGGGGGGGDRAVARLATCDDAAPLTLASVGGGGAAPTCRVEVLECDSKEELEGVLVSVLPQFGAQSGVTLFVLSLLLTRGAEAVQADMDVGGAGALTGQFGHCSQELINLLLCGAATSNVFDGSRRMGDEQPSAMADDGGGASTAAAAAAPAAAPAAEPDWLTLRGVPRRPHCGYLTHLEALKYVSAGAFFKTPQAPVWVVGSSSHFTLLFAVDAARANAESAAERVLAAARGAWHRADSGGVGLVQTPLLAGLCAQFAADASAAAAEVRALSGGDGMAAAVAAAGGNALLAASSDDAALGRLAARMEEDSGMGDGIVLWDAFWRTASVLVTGMATLDEVCSGGSVGLGGAGAGDAFAAVAAAADAAPAADTAMSDADMARALQEQFDREDAGGGAGGGDAAAAAQVLAGFDAPSGGGGGAAVPVGQQAPTSPAVALAADAPAAEPAAGRPRSDSEIARELQAQFNSGEYGGALLAAEEPIVLDGAGATSAPAAQPATAEGALEFDVFHYNGLEGGAAGSTRRARVVKGALSKPIESAIGKVAPLEPRTQNSMGGVAAVDEVIRTKWPCAHIDWQGGTPPSID